MRSDSLEDRDRVAGAVQLLGRRQTRRSDPTTATRLPVRVAGGSGVTQPSSNARSMIATSIALIVTGSSLMPSTHDPSHGAGHSRPVNSGKLFVACRRSIAALPAVAVHEVVPVGDQVAERAALVAEGDAAVHAARALLAQLLVGVRQVDLVPVAHPLGHGTRGLLVARDFDEAGRLTHGHPHHLRELERPALRAPRAPRPRATRL